MNSVCMCVCLIDVESARQAQLTRGPAQTLTRTAEARRSKGDNFDADDADEIDVQHGLQSFFGCYAHEINASSRRTECLPDRDAAQVQLLLIASQVLADPLPRIRTPQT
eukprot:1991230-Amphidinium_carterae.1